MRDKVIERKDRVYTCFSLEETEDESNSKNMTFSAISYHLLVLKTSESPSKKYYL